MYDMYYLSDYPTEFGIPFLRFDMAMGFLPAVLTGL